MNKDKYLKTQCLSYPNSRLNVSPHKNSSQKSELSKARFGRREKYIPFLFVTYDYSIIHLIVI